MPQMDTWGLGIHVGSTLLASLPQLHLTLGLSLDPPIGDLFSTVRRDWHGVRLKEDSFEFFNGDGAPVIKPS